MAKKRVDAILNFPGDPRILASVSTTPRMIVLTKGSEAEQHYTYPPDGRFHLTSEGADSVRSYLEVGPGFDSLDYFRLAEIAVPQEPGALRSYHPSSAQSFELTPDEAGSSVLEIGVVGAALSEGQYQALLKRDPSVYSCQGPRSDTTLLFRLR